MSSFIYPDSATRKLFSKRNRKHAHTYYKLKQKHESMMAKAQRLTEEKLSSTEKVNQKKSFFGKIKSKTINFLTWLFKK